jgi:hypothetical protein
MTLGNAHKLRLLNWLQGRLLDVISVTRFPKNWFPLQRIFTETHHMMRDLQLSRLPQKFRCDISPLIVHDASEVLKSF